jgi:hypothetical protein
VVREDLAVRRREETNSFRKFALAVRGIAEDPSRHKIVIVFSLERYSKAASAPRRCLAQRPPAWGRTTTLIKDRNLHGTSCI